MNHYLVQVVIVLFHGLTLISTARAQPADPKTEESTDNRALTDELFADLLATDAARAVKTALGGPVGDYKDLGFFIEKQLQSAKSIDKYLRELAASYANWRDALPLRMQLKTMQRDDLKVTQNSHIKAMREAIRVIDEVAKAAASQQQDLRWLLLTRTHLRLIRSTPTIADLMPIEATEAGELRKLWGETNAATSRRRKECLLFHERWAEKIRKSGPDFKQRQKKVSEYFTSVELLLKDARKQRTEAAKNNDFLKRWTEWIQEQMSGRPAGPAHFSVLSENLEHSHKPFKLDDANLLVSWPFHLATKLKMGELFAVYDAIGFDGGEEMIVTAVPTIYPRIRLRVEYRPIEPRLARIRAVDLRLRGDKQSLAALVGKSEALPPMPEQFRRQTKPRREDDKDHSPVGDWMQELTAGLQTNPAVNEIIRKYWTRQLEQIWLDELSPLKPLAHVRLATGAVASIAYPIGPYSILASYVLLSRNVLVQSSDKEFGDCEAMLQAIRFAAQEEIQHLAERTLASSTHPGSELFVEARKHAIECQKFWDANADGPRLVPMPEELLREDAQRWFDNWNQHLGEMLPYPLPTCAVVVHPWPSPPPSGMADASNVARNAQRTMERQLERTFAATVAKCLPQAPPEILLQEIESALMWEDSPFLCVGKTLSPKVALVLNSAEQLQQSHIKVLAHCRRDKIERYYLAREICWLINLSHMTHTQSVLEEAAKQLLGIARLPEGFQPKPDVYFAPKALMDQRQQDLNDSYELLTDDLENDLWELLKIRTDRVDCKLRESQNNLDIGIAQLKGWMEVFPQGSPEHIQLKSRLTDLQSLQQDLYELHQLPAGKIKGYKILREYVDDLVLAVIRDRYYNSEGGRISRGWMYYYYSTNAFQIPHTMPGENVETDPHRLLGLESTRKWVTNVTEDVADRVERAARLRLRLISRANPVAEAEKQLLEDFVQRAIEFERFLETKKIKVDLHTAGGSDRVKRGYVLSREELLTK